MLAVRRVLILIAVFAWIGASGTTPQPTTPPIQLRVDATRAPQGLFAVHETMAVSPGALTLVYSHWIPGTHAPQGPIPNVVDLVVRANGAVLPWERDPIDLYEFRVNVPAGVSAVDVDFTFLANAASGYAAGPMTTQALFALEWWKVVLTPANPDYRAVTVAPSIVLPAAWHYATALDTASRDGDTVAFKPLTLEMLLDSPLDAGVNERTIDLGSWDGVPVQLAAFADVPSSLAVDEKTTGQLRALVEQMRALYVHRHFDHYTVLLTLTDVFGNGLEHHQSSDNGTGPEFFTSPAAYTMGATLLPHEFNHSWDGKYRRPAGLATPNLQVPMIDDLLWVYEGLTQFYGELQAERAGMRTREQWLDTVASTYAYYANERGRLTATLGDTARASSIRRGVGAWSSERRAQDYYNEGLLMWTEADALILKHSNGKTSLDDFARAFFGEGADTGPMVKPYTRADLIAALNRIDPYDWATFFATRVDAIAPLPPDPFAGTGYRLTFEAKPSGIEKTSIAQRKSIDAWYSLGFNAVRGTLSDVRVDSPAGKAGLAPGDKIVAIAGRAYIGSDQLDAALVAAKTSGHVDLILNRDDAFSVVSITYRDGPRYPHAERVAGEPDLLGEIATPLR